MFIRIACFFFFFQSFLLFSEDEVLQIKSVKYPKKLSEWKVFLMTEGGVNLNSAVMAYDLVNPLFTDYALKFRTLWVPKGKSISYKVDGVLRYPVGTVLTKTFSYNEKTISRKRKLPPDFFQGELSFMNGLYHVETRVLVKGEDKWHSLPYVWEEDGKDAELSVIGASFELNLKEEDLPEESFVYRVPNMNQCVSCHMERQGNDEIFSPVGVRKARNLNKVSPFDKEARNQLDLLKTFGFIDNLPPLDEIQKVPSWEKKNLDLETKARAYLDINCAHCHSAHGAGNTSGLFLNFENTDKKSLGFCKKPVASGNGSGGATYDINPGIPQDSILYLRMKSKDPSVMMPEIGRSLTHSKGLKLIYEWISGMTISCGEKS